jgi:hypothetical protein
MPSLLFPVALSSQAQRPRAANLETEGDFLIPAYITAIAYGDFILSRSLIPLHADCGPGWVHRLGPAKTARCFAGPTPGAEQRMNPYRFLDGQRPLPSDFADGFPEWRKGIISLMYNREGFFRQ